MDSDEDEDLRRFVKPWQKNAELMFWTKKAGGYLEFVDLSYTDPYNYVKTPVLTLLGGERDEDDEARHAEARRLARLLISEIKLYNEEQVLEGRKNHNVVERLKEDIDRSRELYEERVDERVRQETDYFYQEMVRVLGAGDPKTLGI